MNILLILAPAVTAINYQIPPLKEVPVPLLWEQEDFPAELKSFFAKEKTSL